MTSQGAPEPATALIAALLYNFAAASLISNSLNGCAMLLTSAMLLDVSDSGYCVCFIHPSTRSLEGEQEEFILPSSRQVTAAVGTSFDLRLNAYFGMRPNAVESNPAAHVPNRLSHVDSSRQPLPTRPMSASNKSTIGSHARGYTVLTSLTCFTLSNR